MICRSLKRKMKKIVSGVLFLTVSSCCDFGRSNDPRVVVVPPGPEDVVLLNPVGRDALLVSCDDRRSPFQHSGSLVEVDVVTNDVRVLHRPDETSSFHPQGLALGEDLYVINHPAKGLSEVLRFGFMDDGTLSPKGVVGEKSFVRCCPSLANDLVVLPDGDLLLTSSSLLCGTKDGILRYDRAADHWSMFDGNPPGRFPNGIHVHREHVYVSFSMSKDVYRYRWRGPDPVSSVELVATGVHGGDNFGGILGSKDRFLLSSHRSNIAFGIHRFIRPFCATNSFWEFDVTKKSKRRVVLEDGGRFPVSSASVAVRTRDSLWIGQVFEPCLLRIPATELSESEVHPWDGAFVPSSRRDE